jgi:hypothetical protein
VLRTSVVGRGIRVVYVSEPMMLPTLKVARVRALIVDYSSYQQGRDD